jgi:hypothetical protein
MADNLFSDLIPQAGSKPPTAGGGFTGYIPGVPKAEEPEDPAVVEGRRLENELKRQRLAKGDPMGEGAAKLREGENNAAFLTTNLIGNINIMNRALKVDPSVAVPTWGQVASGILGQDVKNALLPEQRQVIEDSQRIITDAALTLGTGAAYTPAQIEAYRRGFFPQVGDKPAQVEAKRERLRIAMQAARLKAGSAAPNIDQAMQMLGLDPEGGLPEAGNAPPGDNTARGTGEAPSEMGEMDEGQKRAYAAFWKANPDPKPEQLKAFLEGIGVTGIGNTEEVIAAVKSGKGYSTAIDREAVLRAELARQDARAGGQNAKSGTQTLVDQGTTLGLSDEAAGVGRAASRLLQGKDPVEGYLLGRDAERLRIEDTRRQMGYGGTAIEIAGGLVSGNPTGALASVAQLARGGAAGGALAGFGSGEGLAGSAIGAGTGAAVGGTLGAGLGVLSNRVGRGDFRPDVAQAAVDEGVSLPRMMVTGSRRDINRAGALEADTGIAAPIIQQGFADVGTAVEGRVTQLGRGGTGRSEEAIGESVQNAGRRFIQRSRGVADRLYNRARNLAGVCADAGDYAD